MDAELSEIRDFVFTHHPFDQLPKEKWTDVVKCLSLEYQRRGSTVLEPGASNAVLHLIRSGAVEIRDTQGAVLAQLGEGDVFGARSMLRGGRIKHSVITLEDTLLYQLPGEVFNSLCQRYPQFAYYFQAEGGQRLRDALNGNFGSGAVNTELATTPITKMLQRAAVMLPSSASIANAAQAMTAQRVSSILVVDNGQLLGILTDRDIRSRAVALGVSVDQPITRIMTATPHSIASNVYAFDAMLAMVRHNVHHLPVLDHGRPVGVISATDLMRQRTASPVFLVSDIDKQTDVEGLARVSAQLPKILVSMVDADATAHSTSKIISAIGEALTCRLLDLAQEKLGPPPVPFVWLSAGSLARYEQTAHSDQDNALLLDDAYDPDLHGAYFEQLSRLVCDGLNACGYVYCPGNVMASNSQWRQPLRVWKRYFNEWIGSPEPKALMHVSIFFDLRCLYGAEPLHQQLQLHVTHKTASNHIFLAYMAANALHYHPPLGFFRNLVLVRGGEHDQTLDLKHRGVIPIVDLARVYALSSGSADITTQDRLAAVAGKGELSAQGAEDLRDAFEFISVTRLRHQARRIKDDQVADNFMAPNELSNFEREHLKDAFRVVLTLQAALEQRYQSGRFQ
jgi:CBS domain-containing protein